MKSNKFLTVVLLSFIFTLLMISKALSNTQPIQCDHEECISKGYHTYNSK